MNTPYTWHTWNTVMLPGGGGEQIACAVAAGSCPQAPQEYDRLVRLLLCLYTERGSATARRALAALLQDERRMNDEAIP